MRRTVFSALSLVLLAACGSSPAPVTTPSDYSSLKVLTPGQETSIKTNLKVNIVFVGYRQTPPGQVATARQIDLQDFRDTLPATYDSIARIPSSYGRTEKTGNHFTYDYNYVFADQSFEDDFFGYLSSIGREEELTYHQRLYNCQGVSEETEQPDCTEPSGRITRPVTGNLEIDARSTEDWLATNAPRLGISKNEYTVFLVNWYDRPDFKFHSYTKDIESESDTGYRFGELSSRRLIAWGGTRKGQTAEDAQRLWFYDLSANPDPWTDAYDLVNADVDGDKVADVRMFPVWEYGTRRNNLAAGRKVGPDLAKTVRYTALNLLFTPSALYRAELTPPRMPDEIALDLTAEQGAAATPSGQLIKPETVKQRTEILQPFTKFSVTSREIPLDGDVRDVYECYFAEGVDDACSPNFWDFTGEALFQRNLQEIRAKSAGLPYNRYILPVYLFNDDQDAPSGLGIAYDDSETGTQSFVYGFLTPRSGARYGFTDTTVHEIGHHLSLSHPHDGYDSEQDLSYGASGPFLFVNSGDQNDSIMSYIDLSFNFGQFNLDSQYRYLTAAYLNNAGAILEIARRAGQEQALAPSAVQADSLFAQAQAEYDRLNYYGAAKLAHDGYRTVLDNAQANGVEVQGYRWYQNLSGLSMQSQGEKPRTSPNMLPKQGAVIFPHETRYQQQKRAEN